MAGFISQPEDANPDNPIDYLVHVRKIAKPLFPQSTTLAWSQQCSAPASSTP
jgi:hypothetical protein